MTGLDALAAPGFDDEAMRAGWMHAASLESR
jgi:hypothetical protein